MTPRSTSAIRWIWLVFAAAMPTTGFALELDFYTYNGFDETISALQRLSLLVTDNTFLFLVGVFVALGLTIAMVKMGTDGMSGGQINPLAALVPTIFGLALFKALVIPTGTLHVYDPVRNAYEPVGGVPDIVVMSAGLLSKIERAIIQITDTASANAYADSAGAINYSLIKAAMDADLNDVYIERSLIEYYSYCGIRALGQNTTGSWWQRLLHGSEDLADEFDNWQNNVLTVVYYPPGNDAGVTMTCRDAWGAISSRINAPATYDGYIASICTTVGFDPLQAAQLNRCQSLLSDTSALFGVSAPGLIPYLRSVVLAKTISEATNSADFSQGQRALVDRQVMAEGFGTAEAMNSWVPRLRAFMMATVLGLMPLVFLFLVTPLVKAALTLMFGLFTWLALWGACDVIAVQMALDAAHDAFDQIREQQFGIQALLNSPEAAIQALGIFGKARLVALTLATVLSSALFKFGGYAFAQLGQQWQGHLEQAGEAAGRNTMLPETAAGFQRSLLQASGPQAAVASYGFSSAQFGQTAQDMETGAYGSAWSSYVDPATGSGGTASTGSHQFAQTSVAGALTDKALIDTGAIAGRNQGYRESARAVGDDIQGVSQSVGRTDTSIASSASLTTDRLNQELHGANGNVRAGGLDALEASSRRSAREAIYQESVSPTPGVASTPNADLTGAKVRDMAGVEAAGPIAQQQLFTPADALSLARIGEIERSARAYTMGEGGAETAGVGSGLSAEAEGVSTQQFASAFGKRGLQEIGLGRNLQFYASSQLQDAMSLALYGDGSVLSRYTAEMAQQGAHRSVYIDAENAQSFFNSAGRDVDPQHRDAILASGRGFVVSAPIDPDDATAFGADGPVQYSARTDTRTGSEIDHRNVESVTVGQSTSIVTGANLADNALLRDPIQAQDDLELILNRHARRDGSLDDQIKTGLINNYTSGVTSQGVRSEASDIDTIEGTLGGGANVSYGRHARPGMPGIGASASGSGNLSGRHAETGTISADVVRNSIEQRFDSAYVEGLDNARNRYGEDATQWTAIERRNAHELIAYEIDTQLRPHIDQLVTEGYGEAAARVQSQREDLEKTTDVEKSARWLRSQLP